MPDLWQMQVNTKDLMDLHLLHKISVHFFCLRTFYQNGSFFSSSDNLSTGSTVLSVGKYSINAQQGCSSFVSSFLIRTDATKFPSCTMSGKNDLFLVNSKFCTMFKCITYDLISFLCRKRKWIFRCKAVVNIPYQAI